MNKKLLVSLLFLGMGCIEAAQPNNVPYMSTPPSPRKQFVLQTVGKTADGQQPRPHEVFKEIHNHTWSPLETHIGGHSWQAQDQKEVQAELAMTPGTPATQQHWRDKFSKIAIEVKIITNFIAEWGNRGLCDAFEKTATRYGTAMVERESEFLNPLVINFQIEGGYSVGEINSLEKKVSTLLARLNTLTGLDEDDDMEEEGAEHE
jgi:hypothetical protein